MIRMPVISVRANSYVIMAISHTAGRRFPGMVSYAVNPKHLHVWGCGVIV